MSSNNKRIHASRFSAAPFVTEPLDIVLGGLGGVGAYVAFYLSRLQHNLFCYEFDVVEDINLDCQFFRYSDLGKPKATAVSEACYEYSRKTITRLGKYELNSFVGPIVFAMFDNMKARKFMFEKWCELESKQVFVDTRLQAEEFQIFFIQNKPEDIELYRASLRDDSEIPDLPCSYKQTGHYAGMVATQAVALFCNYLANQNHLKEFGEELRECPTFTTFNGLTWMQRN